MTRKAIFLIGITLLATTCFRAMRVRLPSKQDQESSRNSNSSPLQNSHLSDAALDHGNQSAGWVFGRVMGVADAPGSPNHTAFGGDIHLRVMPPVR